VGWLPPPDTFSGVQLFAVACGSGAPGAGRLVEALKRAASAFPELDAGTLEHDASADGRLSFAAIAHPKARAAPRRYLARRGSEVVMFDGLPLPVQDAALLLERWSELELEGIFSAVKLDLEAGSVDTRLDVLGLAKLFRASVGDGFVLSNSLDAVRLATGASSPNPLAISSLLTLGWAVGGGTLLAGVDSLEGPLTPRTAASAVGRAERSVEDVAESLTGLASGLRELGPVTSGLTAGRDTRVMLALARAAALDVDHYTSGHETDLDVVVAREIAAKLGLRHAVISPAVPADWAAASSAFSSQTDGLASFWIVADWLDHRNAERPLGVKLWGAGGGMGRGGMGVGIPLAATAPFLRASTGAHRRIIHGKVATFGGLVTRNAAEETRRYLDRFVADRAAEGWHPRELTQLYFEFERVRYWAAAGVRRAAAATDLWSPFITRAFIEYCWSLRPEARAVEEPHWRLLGLLDARLRDMRFESPWRPQRPRLAPAILAREAMRGLFARRAAQRAPFGLAWIQAGAGQIREAVDGCPDSDLWHYVDREELRRRLVAPEAASAEGLTRVLTVLWWLHGRHEQESHKGREPAALRPQP